MLEREAGEPRGDRGDDEQPRHPLVGSLDSPSPQGAEEAADDPDPVRAEVHEQRDRRRDVQGDDEGEIERLLGRLRVHDLSQPSHAGIRTLCPRLEIGNSSVMPCSIPITMAWK